MTLYQFNLLSEHDLAGTFRENGVFLCSLKTEKQPIGLYQIDASYVEVYYNSKQKASFSKHYTLYKTSFVQIDLNKKGFL